jgi:hypothetical protein
MRCLGKGKVHPRTDHEGPQGGWSLDLLFLYLRLYVGVCGQRHVPAALLPEERPCTHFTGG